jgi:hypothetical protein
MFQVFQAFQMNIVSVLSRRCQWIKQSGAWRLRNLDTLVNLNNVGYKDDMWVLADRVAHVLYYALENPKEHVVISGKQRILGVDGI